MTFTYTKPPGTELRTDVLYRDPYVVVLPSDHALAGSDGVALVQLKDERILLSPRRDSTEAYDAILGACVDSGFSAHDITVERSSYTDQLGLVAAGMGISLLPQRLSRLPVPGACVVPLRSPKLESHVVTTWNPGIDDRVRDRFMKFSHELFG